MANDLDLYKAEGDLAEVVSEMGTNMVVVDDDMRLMKGIPLPSKATTDYVAARVKHVISSLYYNKLVILSSELAVGEASHQRHVS